MTDRRLAATNPPLLQPVVQFHGKWPFYRLFGMQEVFSVVFSLLNLLAHWHGMRGVVEHVPASYPLRRYYLAFGCFGLASWSFSMLFHTRDLALTEKLDYFAAGASVQYGLYLAVVRIFRLDTHNNQLDQDHHPDHKHRGQPAPRSIAATPLRLWTALCVALYLMHVCYLTCWTWDYTYNMAANVAVGVVQNLLWSAFSVRRYCRAQRKSWTAWPGLIVAWLVLAMSLELLDFAPWRGLVDAHSLWHLATVVPTVWWYS